MSGINMLQAPGPVAPMAIHSNAGSTAAAATGLRPQGAPPPLDDFFASLSVNGGVQPPAHAPPPLHPSAGMPTAPGGLQNLHLAGQLHAATGFSFGGPGGSSPPRAPLTTPTGHVVAAGMPSVSGMNTTWSQPQAAPPSAAAWLPHSQHQPSMQQASATPLKGHDAAFDFVKDILK